MTNSETSGSHSAKSRHQKISRHPPGNMYGRHGLKAQLEDLRNNEEIRNTLFVYLGHRHRVLPGICSISRGSSLPC